MTVNQKKLLGEMMDSTILRCTLSSGEGFMRNGEEKKSMAGLTYRDVILVDKNHPDWNDYNEAWKAFQDNPLSKALT